MDYEAYFDKLYDHVSDQLDEWTSTYGDGSAVIPSTVNLSAGGSRVLVSCLSVNDDGIIHSSKDGVGTGEDHQSFMVMLLPGDASGQAIDAGVDLLREDPDGPEAILLSIPTKEVWYRGDDDTIKVGSFDAGYTALTVDGLTLDFEVEVDE